MRQDLFNTASATDTTVVVDHHSFGAVIDKAIDEQVGKAADLHPEAIAEALEVTVAAFLAGGTKVIAFGKKHFYHTFANISQFLGICNDIHPWLDDGRAGSCRAAIYLDGGDSQARRFIERYVGPEIEAAAAGELGGNYKSLLQQLAQREFGNTPIYQLLDEKGPDHAKCFKVSAVVAGKRFKSAWGRNKKEAEQRAARNALAELNHKRN